MKSNWKVRLLILLNSLTLVTVFVVFRTMGIGPWNRRPENVSPDPFGADEFLPTANITRPNSASSEQFSGTKSIILIDPSKTTNPPNQDVPSVTPITVYTPDRDSPERFLGTKSAPILDPDQSKRAPTQTATNAKELPAWRTYNGPNDASAQTPRK